MRAPERRGAREDAATRSHAILDEASRHHKAAKIAAVLRRFVDLAGCRVLDVGTGSGTIVHDLAALCAAAVSVDRTDERLDRSGYAFVRVGDERLPFRDGSFDVVVSNHVIEHVRDQALHVSEMHRVLRPGGVVYLATPNKYWLYDPHYKLPFVSWLPPALAARYLRLVLRKEWDIAPLSRGDVRRLAHGLFAVHELTTDIVRHPRDYDLDTFGPLQPLMSSLPRALYRALDPIVPTFIVVLRRAP